MLQQDDPRASNSIPSERILSEEDQLTLREILECGEQLIAAIERVARFSQPRPSILIEAREHVTYAIEKAQGYLLQPR